MARSLLFMHPRDGCREALIEAFERLGVPDKALEQDGCLSVELQVPRGDADPVLVTALWANRNAYDGWLANPWRDETSEELFSLLRERPEGVVYDVRLAAGKAIPDGGSP